jgi:PAS domain S-box-containing protein
VPAMGVDAWSALYDLIVSRAARLVGARDALLWLTDDEGELVVRRGIGRFSAAVGRRLGEEAVEAGLCVPLAAGGSVVGLLGVAWSDPGRVAGQAESELLGGWGELAAVMIDRARRADAAGSGGRTREHGWLPGDVERYRVLSEQIPAALYSEVHTPGGAVVHESPQYQKLFGYTPEEITQPDFWKSLVHPDDREWVLAENDPEEALRQVLERERQALERERQAARELRALDEMKNTFLDAVSHELRTPLATVIGIALTLQRAGSSLSEEDTADLVDRLVANAGKLDRLLADLLDLDRLSKGILAPRRSRTDLAALVDRVAHEWRQRSGRQLEVVAEPVVAWVQDRPGGGASFQVLLPDSPEPADVGGVGGRA